MKKFAGWALLVAMLAAPFAAMTRNAEAADIHSNVCYFGKVGRPLGIIIQVETDVANLMERARISTIHFSDTGRDFRRYDVCVRAEICDRSDNHLH